MDRRRVERSRRRGDPQDPHGIAQDPRDTPGGGEPPRPGRSSLRERALLAFALLLLLASITFTALVRIRAAQGDRVPIGGPHAATAPSAGTEASVP